VVGTSIVPVLGRLRQEKGEFKINLGYMVRTSPKDKTKKGKAKPNKKSSFTP
jgi:hypothetical protein